MAAETPYVILHGPRGSGEGDGKQAGRLGMHDLQGAMDGQKARAAAWFRTLRADIVASFEELEDSQRTGAFAGLPPASDPSSDARFVSVTSNRPAA